MNVQKVHETPERLYVYRDSVHGEANDRSEEESLTANMNPQEKPEARRRNPEGGNSRTPKVLSSRQEPTHEVLRQRELSDDTQGSCMKYKGPSADTLESARGEIRELRKGLKSVLNQLDISEANGGHKPLTYFPK